MNARTRRTLLAALLLLPLSIALTGLLLLVRSHRRASGEPATFAELRDHDIPGRYKMYEGARKQSFIVLYSDHTFMNEDGTIYPQYRWDLASNSLSLTWQKNATVFSGMESAGVYLGAKEDGTALRLEKLPPYPRAQLALPPPIAMLRLESRCETNGLVPVHTNEGEDGEIFPVQAAGVDCFQLVRKPGKNDAYLYLQIAPEFKSPPFTNGLVVVEFFDRASTVGRAGRLLVHYDDEKSGAYALSQPLSLAGNESWQEATFYLATPFLQGRQSSGADLRLVVNRSQLPIRSVKVLKNVPYPENKMPTVTPR